MLGCLQTQPHPLSRWPSKAGPEDAAPPFSCPKETQLRGPRGEETRPAGAHHAPPFSLQSEGEDLFANCRGALKTDRIESLPKLELSKPTGAHTQLIGQQIPQSSPQPSTKTRQKPKATASPPPIPQGPQDITKRFRDFPSTRVCKHTRVGEKKRSTAGQEGNLIIKGKPVFQENLHLVGTLP